MTDGGRADSNSMAETATNGEALPDRSINGLANRPMPSRVTTSESCPLRTIQHGHYLAHQKLGS